MPLQQSLGAQPGLRQSQGQSRTMKGPTRAESAGSRRFLPAQQAVAAGLLVVMKRAYRHSRDIATAAMLTLGSNNRATRPLLMMLPDGGPPPTMKEIEQRASDELLESLTKLANQCAAAQCQPLEVFTRSVQCIARSEGEDLHAPAKRGPYDWDQSRVLLQRMPSYSQECVKDLQRQGMSQSIANLWIALKEVISMYEIEEEDGNAWYIQDRMLPDLNHMLPGLVSFVKEAKDDATGDAIPRLVTTLTTALKTYHIRAATCGQSFEHMVLLEAAVQGWSLETPNICSLLRAMLAAEPPESSSGTAPARNAPQASLGSAVEAAPEQAQAPQSHALSCLMKCPSDVLAIFKQLICIMDLSAKDLSPLPARPLNREERRLKILLTGLFPGTREELYCACDSKNAYMCPELFTAATRHVQSHIQVWRSEAKEQRLRLPQLLRDKLKLLGLQPNELPEDVESAIHEISTRLRGEPANKMEYHHMTTFVMDMMHQSGEAGMAAMPEFWLLKLDAQRYDLRIYADEHRVRQADQTLLTGPHQARLDPQILAGMSRAEGYLMTLYVWRSLIQKHARDAQPHGRTLRAHLENLAGLRRSGWEAGKSDVAHLITIMADRAFQEEGPSGEGWRKFALEDPEMAEVLESACKLALRTCGTSQYANLHLVLQGLPQDVPACMSTNLSQLREYGAALKQYIKCQMLLASSGITGMQKMPFRPYMEIQFRGFRIDTGQDTGGPVLEAICKAADAFTADKSEDDSSSDDQTNVAASASPSTALEDSSSGADEPLSRAKVSEAAADGINRQPKAQTVGQQGGDKAADVAGGTNSKKLADQGHSKPEQDVQDTAQSQGGASEAEKTEKKKAKKVRQRAARAQAAAQKAEAEGTSSKDLEPEPKPEPELLESKDSASKREQSAEAKPDEQPPEGVHLMSAFSFAALESNPADSAPAISREEAPSSRTSSVSPQPSLQLHNGSSLEHDGERLPKSSAQPAQALAPAAQEEGPWQEVRTSRRKSGSQQAASKPTAQDPPRQGSRGKPNQEYSSPPPTPPPRKSQAAAQHPEEAPPNSGKGGVPPQAPPGLAAAGHWPQKPEPLPQPESPDSQLHPWPQELPSSMQIGSPQAAKADFIAEGDQDKEEELCVVCWERAPEVIFYHCMHMCTCQGCAKDIMAAGALCPMCRASIRSTITAKF